MTPIYRLLLSIITLLWLCDNCNAFSSITVSGVSSGGAMAVQFHVAFSSIVSGAGIVAGAPYYCANANAGIAVTSCMVKPELISITELRAATNYAYSMRSIDNPKHLANSKVYIFAGSLDSVVVPGVSSKVYDYYHSYTSSSNINLVRNIGRKCSYLGEPYINNCGYDTPASLFVSLLGKMVPSVSPLDSNLKRLDQHQFLPRGVLPAASAMDRHAYYYLPTSCKSNSKAFHGCKQTLKDINTTYVTGTGYNGWAEANSIIVLYPQATANHVNPQGCWDWWGYTGLHYATKHGVQVATVKNIVDHLSSRL